MKIEITLSDKLVEILEKEADKLLLTLPGYIEKILADRFINNSIIKNDEQNKNGEEKATKNEDVSRHERKEDVLENRKEDSKNKDIYMKQSTVYKQEIVNAVENREVEAKGVVEEVADIPSSTKEESLNQTTSKQVPSKQVPEQSHSYSSAKREKEEIKEYEQFEEQKKVEEPEDNSESVVLEKPPENKDVPFSEWIGKLKQMISFLRDDPPKVALEKIATTVNHTSDEIIKGLYLYGKYLGGDIVAIDLYEQLESGEMSVEDAYAVLQKESDNGEDIGYNFGQEDD